MRCAVVEPTNPPPTTVTFFRIPSPQRFSIDYRGSYVVSPLRQVSAKINPHQPKHAYSEESPPRTRRSSAFSPPASTVPGHTSLSSAESSARFHLRSIAKLPSSP